MELSMTRNMQTTMPLEKMMCASSPFEKSKPAVSAVNVSRAMQDFFSNHFSDVLNLMETDASDESESSEDSNFDESYRAIEVHIEEQSCQTSSPTKVGKQRFSVCEIPEFKGYSKSARLTSVHFYVHPGDCEADETFSFTMGKRTKAMYFDEIED